MKAKQAADKYQDAGNTDNFDSNCLKEKRSIRIEKN